MEIVDAPEIITMEDSAGDIMKTKKDSSMAVGLQKACGRRGCLY